jgi:hypothetical protein
MDKNRSNYLFPHQLLIIVDMPPHPHRKRVLNYHLHTKTPIPLGNLVKSHENLVKLDGTTGNQTGFPVFLLPEVGWCSLRFPSRL